MSEHKMYRRPVCKYCESQEINQPNRKTTIKTVVKVREKLDQSTENSERNKEGIQNVKENYEIL